MELFGVCNNNYSESRVLIRATKISAFGFYEEFANLLREKEINENQDYNHITNEKLRIILDEIEEVLINVYNQEKSVLITPNVDKSSKLFKLGYREVYLEFLKIKVSINFSNSTHKKIEQLDNLVFELDTAIKQNKIGFFYTISGDLDSQARSIWKAFQEENDEISKNLIPEEILDLLKKQGLVDLYTEKVK